MSETATPRLFRIVDENPYLSREDEYPGLTLEAAAAKMEDLTGVGADVILADVEDDCPLCHASGCNPRDVTKDCPACHGSCIVGEWEWEDTETGREVTMRLEEN